MTNLSEIKGIGPKIVSNLSKLNINNIDDLLTYYPYRYNILNKTTLSNTIDNIGLVCGVIESDVKVAYIRINFNSLNFIITI